MTRILSFLALVLLSLPAFAQPQKVVADKIVAIVGDKIILRSDVYNEIQDRQRRNEEIPANANCAIIDQILLIKAMTLQAEKDSVIVSDDEIEADLDNKIRYYASNYGGKEALEEIAGKTVYQLKEDFRASTKEMMLAKKMQETVVQNVKITPQEAKAYWDKIPKDSLPFYESEVEIGEIVIYPKASRDFEKLAQDELNDYRSQIDAKTAKIETLASLYSDDPGVKTNGGQYTINRTEKTWDPSFIQAAFRLKEGQVSPVFKSKFGYHIIQMVTRAGDDAVVRHILRIPRITDPETNQAVAKLDSVRALLIAGKMTFGEASIKFGEDQNAKFTGGLKQGQNGTYLTIDQLDKDLVLMLDKMAVGEFSRPVSFLDDSRKTGVRIVYLKSRTEPHRENMKDDYSRIAARALEYKKQEAIEKWFNSKLPNYYIQIDPEFADCPNLTTWFKYAVASAQ
ncbi:MAG: peptidylprolyl isomerase [Chitinophagaceae bacterium]|nr:peptidylprolyl isomerase [Chitinophagaceae bacterium]